MLNLEKQIMNIERGDILLIEFDPTRGSEIKKTRPAAVVTNNLANEFSPVITIIPITSQNLNKIRVFEVLITSAVGLKKASKAIVAQIRTVDRSRIQKKIGHISPSDIKKIDLALRLHLDLD